MSPEDPAHSTTPITLEMLMPVFDQVQLEQLKELTKPDGTPLFNDLVALLIREMPERLSRLSSLYQNQQFDEIGPLAHRIGGSCASVGAVAMRKRAQSIENAAKSARWKRMPELFERLNEAWDTLHKELLQMTS